MKKVAVVGYVILVLLVVRCVSLKQSWDRATPQDRAAVVLYGFQKSLDVGLDAGIAYVKVHPEKRSQWEMRIVPMFDSANKLIRELIVKSQTGSLTVSDVTMALTIRFNEINTMMAGWGVQLKF